MFFKLRKDGFDDVRFFVAESCNLSHEIGAGFIGVIMQQYGGANIAGCQSLLRSLGYLESCRDLGFEPVNSVPRSGVRESHDPTIAENGGRSKE